MANTANISNVLPRVAVCSAVTVAALALGAIASTPAYADTNTVQVYRLYNGTSGEHLYTTDWNEVKVLFTQHGWGFENVAWNAPASGTPVYRLYNSGLNTHHFTSDTNEIVALVRDHGWTMDNNASPLFYSGGGYPVYRVYNEELNGMHHLTTSKGEYDALPNYGWEGEGISFYCSALGVPFDEVKYYPEYQLEPDPDPTPVDPDPEPEPEPEPDPEEEEYPNNVVKRAYEYLGKAEYVYGACAPGQFDCSGFVSYCLTGEYKRLGNTYTFMTWPRVSNPQPGDVVTNETHCGIYIGNGRMIHCADVGIGVVEGPVQAGMIYVRYPYTNY